MSNNLPAYAADAVWRLALALPVDDRDAFEAAAFAKIGELTPSALGPGSVDRAIRPIWRSFFRPPEIEERPTRWGQERAKPSELSSRDEDDRPRRRRVVDRRPRPVVFRGRLFRSRRALAEHLEPLLGRNATAIEMMLFKFADDAEATVAHYAGKRRKALAEA